MGQESRQGSAGQQPQQPRPAQPHLQQIGQLHRQRGAGGGEGTEEGVLEPYRVLEGGQNGGDQHQDAAAAQRRAKIQEDKAAQYAAAQGGQRGPARTDGR